MQKIIIIGCPGSGKSTFARKLKNKLNLPFYYLDMIYHNTDKTTISKQEFDIKLNEILCTEKWIIDGNYQRTLETRLKKCDTVFLLDFPLEICLQGATSRIGTKREDMPYIETNLDEDFRNRIIEFSKQKLPTIYELLEKYKQNKNIYIFKTREDCSNFLLSL